MSSPPTPQQAWRHLEYIAAEFTPQIRAINARSLAHICQAIARERPGYIADRIEALMARSGLATTLVGPKPAERSA